MAILTLSKSGDAEWPIEAVRTEIARRFAWDPKKIETILPCTPFQCDVLDQATEGQRRDFGRVIYEIPNSVDIQRLATAWRQVAHQISALRVHTWTSATGRHFQAVLSKQLAWFHVGGQHRIEDIIVQEEETAAKTEFHCNRFTVFEELGTGRTLLIWTFGHSLVDGAFEQRILRRVNDVYGGANVQRCPEIGVPPQHPSQNSEDVARFWLEQLDGMDAAVFPALQTSITLPRPDAQAEHRISIPHTARQEWSESIICRAALALILARYTNASEAVFGLLTERPVVTRGEHVSEGPTRTVVPVRALCDSRQSVVEFLQALAVQDARLGELEQAGLRGVRSAGEAAAIASSFQTVLTVTTTDDSPVTSNILHRVVAGSDIFAPYNDRTLLIHCQISGGTATLLARHDARVIDGLQVNRFLRQLGSLIQQIAGCPSNQLIKELVAITDEDHLEIKNWNSGQIQTSDVCIHDMVTTKAVEAPNKPAIKAWDGEWTYEELEAISSRLAWHLQSLGRDLGQVIPICFEKSRWLVASILAVLKVGRAFTLIDPSNPRTRIAQICRQTSAAVGLASPLQHDLVRGLFPHCVVVDDEILRSAPVSPQKSPYSLTMTSPHDLAYVLFTSGSTGEPKGSLIEHRGFASCSNAFGPALGINGDTRALQFSSCSFGACLVEMLTTLTHGGCVCIPSDSDRVNNVPGFIKDARVNWALFTPSFVGAIRPESVYGLQTLVLGGEPLSAETKDLWASRVRLVFAYGQSETSTICSVTDIKPDTVHLNEIGHTAGARFWITDPDDPEQLAPVGCIGELVIESPGVARGYLEQATQGQSPFVACVPSWYPTDPTTRLPPRLYRTGDLVCYRSDGRALFLGRKDSQVKIRGQRVELGEVESRLRQLSSTYRPVVDAITMSNKAQKTVLIAFLVDPSDKASGKLATGAFILGGDEADSIKKELREVLPEHSIPSFFIRVPVLPTTRTGKTDRKQLRAIGLALLDQTKKAHVTRPQPLPERNGRHGHLEETLRQFWFKSLGVELDSSNLEDDFFKLGGDSITAIKLVNMARLSGITVKVTDIFSNPTPSRLAAAIQQGSKKHAPIVPAAYQGPVEQSFSQGGLWFLYGLNPGSSSYHMPLAVRLRGPIQVDALQRALSALEQRHEALRTTFGDDDAGVGMQIVQPAKPKSLRVIDISATSPASYLDALQQERDKTFDLASEPGWRVVILRLGDEDHILSIVMHHIISDGWSLDVLSRDLGQFYAAAIQRKDDLASANDLLSAIRPLPIQYRDFAAWQKQPEQVANNQRQLKYWMTRLADSSPAELLTDRPRPVVPSGRTGIVEITVEGALYEAVRDFSRARHTTSFVVLLAAFRAAHYRLTGAEDANIGTPVANRNRPELEDLVGLFVNTQCMRIAVGHDDTFETLTQQIHSTATTAFENQDVPFESIVSALPGSRNLSRNPLVQLLFALHSQKDLGTIRLQGLASEPLPLLAYTRLDVEFHLFQEAERFSGNIVFQADLFESRTIENLMAVFKDVLSQGLAQPDTPIAVLPLTTGLTELEQMGLLEVRRTDYPRDESIVDVFRRQVALYPQAVAVVDSSSRLSYSQLDDQSDKVAAWLNRRHMAPETLVGVLAPRSCRAIVAFLGILKANLAYLPLDVNVPASRITSILSAVAGNKLVLVGNDVQMPEFEQPGVELVRIQDALSGDDHQAEAAVDASRVGPSATSLAYVIFTSGSTGKPKGVLVEHRGVVRLLTRNGAVEGMPRATRLAHLATLSSDFAVTEIYLPLLNGGTVICVDYLTALDGSELGAVFEREAVDTVMLQPVLLKQFLTSPMRARFSSLGLLYVGGDRFDARDATEACKLVGNVYQGYGPTENTMLSTYYKVTPEEDFVNGVPIGRSVDNSGAYIMDLHQQLVPLGVMGELVVTGDGLARGYTDPAMNLNRFVEVEINGRRERAYRTGDRARYRPSDGQMEFFGRMDQQVKIRGYRVEPAEVEQALLGCSAVQDAAVVSRTQGDETELVGFVTTHQGALVAQETAGNQVQEWGDHFESGYQDLAKLDLSAVGKDFVGWTSMYDGAQIAEAEMREWLQDTIETIVDGRPPAHVLEVGTGTGMILFNLGHGLQSYTGLEPSSSAAAFVNTAIKSIPSLADKAVVRVGTAADVASLALEGFRQGVVVLNSVMQYFPSPEYLSEVVNSFTQIPGVERLFFGDIRPYSLNRQFLASRALFTLGDNATKDAIRRKMTELEEQEEEFLVDPAFFIGLTESLSDKVKHVEILPKRMRATNELSAFRYTAVLHLRNPEEREEDTIHAIDVGDAVDYQATNMDRDALVKLLRKLPKDSKFAVGNIPWSKAIVEKHLLESLDEAHNQDTLDGWAWISAIREKAKRCASLSATDLVELAEEAGFRVELSWARQRSNQGALDAVFHNIHTAHAGRVKMRFPFETQDQRVSQFTNRPIQHLQSRQTEKEIHKQLEAVLPSYMMPARIVSLAQMPVNATGKVDRKELARMARTVPKKKTAGAARVPPRNEVEAVLCEELADVLGAEVGVTSNFFDLGGHSLMATKLASRTTRRLGVRVSVRDVFDRPVLADLAEYILTHYLQNRTSGDVSRVEQDHAPFQLIPFHDRNDFVRDEIKPLLDPSQPNILDAYPATWLQKSFLHDSSVGRPRPPTVFLVDFPPNTDFSRLHESCRALVQHFDIFRSVFVCARGKFFQVVLEHLDVPIETVEVQGDVSLAINTLLEQDLQDPLRLGSSLLRITIFKTQLSTALVVIRMSHAIYDGLSFEHVVRSLQALYRGDSLPATPSFSEYIQHSQASRTDGFPFWRSLLHSSSMTIARISNKPFDGDAQPQPGGTWMLERLIENPLQGVSGEITAATVFTAACALMLANHAGSRDLVFGRVVSGRQCLPINCQNLIGPCTNVVPVRVCVEKEASPTALLRAIQQQYLSSLPFETLGLEEIKEHCTDWPDSTTNYGFCTTYQNFEVHSESRMHRPRVLSAEHDGTSRYILNETPLHDLSVEGFPTPDGQKVLVILYGARRADETLLEGMLKQVCEEFAALASSLKKARTAGATNV